MDNREEPEPTVAAIEAALGRGADPNAALEWEHDQGITVTVRWPALVLLAHYYDRADCARHCFLCTATNTPTVVAYLLTLLVTLCTLLT